MPIPIPELELELKFLELKMELELHEPRIFYPSGHWSETVTNAYVSAHFR